MARNNVETVSEKNVFKMGILVCPKFYIGWGGYTHLPKEALEEKGFPTDIIRAMKSLLSDRTALQEVQRLMSEAHSFIRRNSIPFPVPSLYFVPKTKFEDIDEGLRRRKERVEEAFEDFLSVYEEDKKNYKKKHKKYFDESKYPSKQALRARFKFDWTYRVFEPPSSGLKVISPKIYKEEMKKFKEEIDGIKQGVANEIAGAMRDRLSKFIEQANEGRANNGTITAIRELIRKTEELYKGFIGEEEINKALRVVKEAFEDTSAFDFRENEDFREAIRDEMENVVSTFERSIENSGRRSIDL